MTGDGIRKFWSGRLRFDRHEFAGSFGDIGTDFPLIVSMILAAHLDPASVLTMFGTMQILTGLTYGIPMPVQPLKAMAVMVISQKIAGHTLFGAGLAIGLSMLVLTMTGLVTWIARIVPKTVVRGIQFGLGLQLSLLALKDYVVADGLWGYGLAAVSFIIVLFLLGHRRYPAALVVIGLGLIYAIAAKVNIGALEQGIGWSGPKWNVPTGSDIITGFIVLALPQLCLSIGNSVLATSQVVKDCFPQKTLGVRKIAMTYSLMNIILPFFSGIPVCHGSGGLVGHYTFGARTGGSVVIYGLMYVILGLLFGRAFGQVAELFPKPMLGIILLFEGWALMNLIRDVKDERRGLGIVLLVGLAAVGLKYGYVIGLIGGTVLYYLTERRWLHWEQDHNRG